MATTLTLPRVEVREERPARAGRVPYWLPLALILTVQAVLTAALLHIGHFSGDEARYTYAGIQLWHELFHGGGSPYFETYFSGAPDLYSPMAAIAWWVGGVTAVRMLSLCFMLVATTILFLTTNRLFGYFPALCAAGIFAGLGMTHELGSYADYDSLALMCTAFAFYCAIRSLSTSWFLVLPLAILAANFAKYVTLAFDPVIICAAGLALQSQGWRKVLARCTVLCLTVVSLLLLALLIAGSAYKQGIFFTTVARPPGTQAIFQATTQSYSVIVHSTGSWMGLVLVAGVVALLLALFVDRQKLPMLLLLMLAGVLVTVEGLHLHTNESMKRHDDFSAWFASIPAAWLISFAVVHARVSAVRIPAMAVASAIVVALGIHYYPQGVELYPAQDSVLQQEAFSQLKPLLVKAGTHEILLGGTSDDAMLMTDRVLVPWWQKFDDVYIKYPIPGRGGDSHGITRGRVCFSIKPGCMYLEGLAGYRQAIKAHWFAFISLIGQHTGLPNDAVITSAVEHTPGYVLINTRDSVSTIKYGSVGNSGGPTWIYLPDYERRA